MSGPVHFEIQADDLDRAQAFYGAVFGWTFEDYSQITGAPYFGIVAGTEGEPGINGGLLQRPVPAPAPEQGTNAFVCTMGTADYDETEAKILQAGGQVALPKYALPGMAWQGYYLDTEGNTFGIHQPDENAA
ncbi:VOC family protein [Tessaracoccus sp. SD287]|uniref:VOC family protein n=1 Tax=Tessaracoccus sp. SD287 TaxID=2782008 RepID=UPI001A966555|nr:VOC family protein [Tessaracoccus sp. SD287]MBO1030709.1 VOC family protein [Tessaracoccus sp. SD287]